MLARDRDSRRLRLQLAPETDPPFGQPSSYSLSHPELAAHVRQLRQAGWQPWEIRRRFDFSGCGSAA